MSERKVFVDIGGGTTPDFFINKARRETDAHFIVLDPTIRQVESKPDNLHLVKWQIDDNNEIPLLRKSIDGIYINNLYYELRTQGSSLNWSDPDEMFDEEYDLTSEAEDHERQNMLYQKILRSGRRVLKPSGFISITEPLGNVSSVLKLGAKAGFKLLQKPHRVIDTDQSIWTRWFQEVHDAPGSDEERERAVPVEISLKPKRTFLYRT